MLHWHTIYKILYTFKEFSIISMHALEHCHAIISADKQRKSNGPKTVLWGPYVTFLSNNIPQIGDF